MKEDEEDEEEKMKPVIIFNIIGNWKCECPKTHRSPKICKIDIAFKLFTYKRFSL